MEQEKTSMEELDVKSSDSSQELGKGDSGVLSHNPMGESNKGTNKTLIFVGLAILGFVVLAVLVVVFLLGSKDDSANDYTYDSFDDSVYDSTYDDPVLTPETEDDYILLMLTQYQVVVDATAEDVSWEEYLVELERFVDIVRDLDRDFPDPTLDEALTLFEQSLDEYHSAVLLDDPDAEVDEEGIAQAGETINLAQEKMNEYLDNME